MIRFDFLHDPLPESVRRLLALRLPAVLYPAALACVTAICAIALVAGIEAVRGHAARALELRAQLRFETSRRALNQLSLQTQLLDTLVARDRRLRAIRLSGSLAAQRLARTGNAFPKRTRLTSISAQAPGYLLKGQAEDLAAIEALVANFLADGAVGSPNQLRITRADRGVGGRLEFELQLQGGR